MAGPVIKLRCTSWGQLATIYERDLRRSMLFVRTTASLPLGREVRVDIIMPSGTVVNLEGRVARLVPAADPNPGIELVLTKLPPSAMWMIESALGRTKQAAAEPAADAAVYSQPEDEGTAEAEEQLVAALEAELRSFRTMQPHQILGIAHDAGEAAARAAFGELSKKYHPDRFARFESDLARRVASDVFVVLRDAYRRMSDTGGSHRPPLTGPAPTRMATPPRHPPRAAEDSGRGAPRTTLPPPPMPTDQHRVTSPAVPSSTLITFSSGRPAAGSLPPTPPRDGAPPFDYGDAPRLSMEYLFGDLGPAPKPAQGPLALEEPQLAEADRLLDGGQLDAAVAAYDELLRQNPTHRGARAGRELVHGLRKVAAGDREGAAQHFELALEIEPWSDRAARELATLRRKATDRGKGLLAKLLGKGGGS